MAANPDAITAVATVAIAVFTVVLAVASGVQAWLTRSAIELTRREFSATHRPKLRVRLFRQPSGLDAHVPLTLRYELVNVGQTAARVTAHRLTAQTFAAQGGGTRFDETTEILFEPEIAAGESRPVEWKTNINYLGNWGAHFSIDFAGTITLCGSQPSG